MATEVVAVGRTATRRRAAGAAGDAIFQALTFAFAVFVLLILGGFIVSLVEGALPALL